MLNVQRCNEVCTWNRHSALQPATKPEEALKSFQSACYPISPVQKNVHSSWHEGFTSIEPQNIQGEGERWGREREGGAKKVGVFLVFSAVDQFEWSECWAKSIMPS